MKTRRALLALLPLLLLVACFGDPIVVKAPLAGAVIEAPTLEVEIRRPVAAGDISLTLNGAPLSGDDFTVTTAEKGALVEGSLPASALVVGLNHLTVTAVDGDGKTHRKAVEFKYLGAAGDPGALPEPDTAAPVLTMASPVGGSFHPVGAKLAVHGTIEDATATSKLVAYLDGVAHDVTGAVSGAGFSFDVEVGKPGLHSVKLEATDSFGNVGRVKVSFFGGAAKPSGSIAPHAVGLSVTAEGLAVVAELIEAELAPEKVDLGGLLSAANPIWSDSAGIASAELHVTGASYTGVELSLVPHVGGLGLTAKLDGLKVALKAKVKMGVSLTLTGKVFADGVSLGSTAAAVTDPSGKLHFAMTDTAMALSGFGFDIDGFPDVLESLASKAVAGFLEKKLAAMIEDKATAVLDRELGSLTLSKTLHVGGHPVAVSGTLESVGIGPSGISASLGTAFEATEPDPFHEPLGGYLHTPNGTPPGHTTSAMFYLAVSDDTLNQAFYEAFRAGALSFAKTETLELKGVARALTVGLLETYLGKDALKKAGIGESTPIKLVFEAKLPPVAHFRKGAVGMAVVSLHDLALEIHAGSLKLFGFELDLTLPIDVKVPGDARLVPVLYPSSTGLDLRIVDEPVVDLPDERFEPLLADLARAVLPELVAGIDGLPLPKVKSLSLSGVALDVREGYLQVFADLVGPGGAAKTHGAFSALSYNVAGLPEGLSSSHPFTNQPLISPMLNKYDLVLVQEDFFYHELLARAVSHAYASEPYLGYLKELRLASDGLNRFSRTPFGALARHKWEVYHGIFDHANDGLSAKGFSFARHTLAPGVTVDVYNLHADAGGSAGDVAARAAQFEQLLAFIKAHSAGHAVIVAGDTNLEGFDPHDEPVLAKFLAAAGLTDVARHLGAKVEKIDRFFFRSSEKLVLEPTHWRIADEFVDAAGEPLSDHEAIHVDFAWKLKK